MSQIFFVIIQILTDQVQIVNPIKCPELETSINVNPNTHDPDKAWDLIKNKINKTKIDQIIPLETPIFENKVNQQSNFHFCAYFKFDIDR